MRTPRVLQRQQRRVRAATDLETRKHANASLRWRRRAGGRLLLLPILRARRRSLGDDLERSRGVGTGLASTTERAPPPTSPRCSNGSRRTSRSLQGRRLLGSDLAIAFLERTRASTTRSRTEAVAGSFTGPAASARNFWCSGLTIWAGGLLVRAERFDIAPAAHQMGGGPGPVWRRFP